MIPDHFQAIFRYWKRKTDNGILHAVAIFHQFRSGSGFFGCFVNPLRTSRTPMGWVHFHFKGIIQIQHRLMTGCQLIGILTHILFGNSKQNSVIAKRVRMMHSWFISFRRRGNTPFPGRNGAGFISGHFTTHRCQVLTQPCDFLGCYFGTGRGGDKNKQ